jgi:hypothetical protein
MVVVGVMGLRLGEVQKDEGNPFRGSIGAEGRWMGLLHGEARGSVAMEAVVLVSHAGKALPSLL